ncbi:MAG: hypothetical protein IJX09_03275 [Clostridia bacterium]|nr:hypothetical protein [Clostridia bacterium]
MEKKTLSKNKTVVLWNLARLVVYMLAILLTPFLAKPIAILFDPVVSDWWQRGDLRVFYTGLATAFLWLGEIIGLFFLDRHLQKKFNVQIDPAKPHAARRKAGAASKQTEQAEQPAQTEQEQEAAATVENTAENAEKATPVKSAPQKPKTQLLGWDRIIAIFLICVACVLIVSAQIGFEVKVFYELGERVVLIDVVNFSGTAGRDIAKCGWIVLLIKASFGLFEGIFEEAKINAKAKKVFVYLCVTALILAFGAYDVLSTQNPFAWTYLLFYVAFVALYALLNRAPIKSYLLILFIYFF